MTDRNGLLKKVEAAQRELEQATAALKKSEEVAKELGVVKTFAIDLHNQQCRLNHTDYCEFEYRNPLQETTWTEEYGAHKRYLEKATAILDVITLAQAYKILPVL